jgi:competence protein ComEA
MLYSRPQLKLLLALAATFLVGLGVREWRAGFPDLAERLERFDREEPAAPVPAGPRAERHPSPSASGAGAAVVADTRDEARGSSAAVPRGERAGGSAGDRLEGGAERRLARTRTEPPAPAGIRPVDINRASAAELARLPGVGPALADRIVAERERRGRFDSPEALRYVLGVGPKKLAAIRELVTVDEQRPETGDAPDRTSSRDARPARDAD